MESTYVILLENSLKEKLRLQTFSEMNYGSFIPLLNECSNIRNVERRDSGKIPMGYEMSRRMRGSTIGNRYDAD